MTLNAERVERIKAAKELFVACCELDGYGLAVTDEDLLAETLAEWNDITPDEVSDDYEEDQFGPPAEKDDEEEEEEPNLDE